MEIKYTKHFLHKLEDLFAESDYVLRYEKGHFQSGYCILKDTKVAIINKFYPLEGRINSLIEIIRSINIDTSNMKAHNKELFDKIVEQ